MNSQNKVTKPSKRQRAGTRWMMLLAAFPMVALLSSCGVTGRMTDTGCLWTKQIRVSQQDVLTDLTARELLGHNKARAERCP